MKKPPASNDKRKVLLWPESKVYDVVGPMLLKQRTPLLKFSCVNYAAPQMIYFQGDPIILN